MHGDGIMSYIYKYYIIRIDALLGYTNYNYNFLIIHYVS